MDQDEYPHVVVFQTFTKVPDGAAGHIKAWKNVLEFNGFLDTPSSREIFKAHQLNNPLDRNLYYPYRTDVDPKLRCTCEGDTYELVGRPQDQGGQHEVMKVALKLVPHGS
ncbi:phage head closure protein [Paenisporosarcina sp. OV554]|uniref:phage head closure protein n=1 Tax=Paenisporosarcina sp. OV554 TaxID=2135694 RepID=UPI000D3DB674|nr:phage head closure protein [Paenisporosarcina sp. OV554]PUB12623.1 SPP1 family predicted phage head-tail adaptor [Paenisporosarcina sp. OV554]